MNECSKNGRAKPPKSKIIMNRKSIVIGAVLGMTGVLLGAFAAHGLNGKIDAASLASFQTGVRYQMYHAIVLLVLGFNVRFFKSNFKWMINLMVVGVVLFSGSIFLLSTQTLTGIPMNGLGWITPVGGSLLIMSWVLLLITILKRPAEKPN